jgi:hypothetical protein
MALLGKWVVASQPFGRLATRHAAWLVIGLPLLRPSSVPRSRARLCLRSTPTGARRGGGASTGGLSSPGAADVANRYAIRMCSNGKFHPRGCTATLANRVTRLRDADPAQLGRGAFSSMRHGRRVRTAGWEGANAK